VRLITAGALATLAAALGGIGTARADCAKPIAVPNPPLVRNDNGTYPSDPALPFPGSHTKWTVDKMEIKLSIDGSAPAKQFYIDGVDYEPTQIGGSAKFTPFNDFFYQRVTGDVKLWAPIWQRDIPSMRAVGINAIRTYGWWKWEPGFLKEPTVAAKDGVADFWSELDFTATNQGQFSDQAFCKDGGYSLQHPDHRKFLNMMWNDGKDPIYVWIGVSVPLELVDPNIPIERRANLRQFYLYTARWLAKKYGDHPAVMGFAVGNELGNGTVVKSSDFWDLLNDLNAIIKASAPDKLTMAVFHDGPDWQQTITSGQFKGLTPPQVYKPDIWAFNPYNNPTLPGNAFTRFKASLASCKRPDNTSCVKPMVFGEFGTPADTHQVTAKSYPVKWVAQNFVWMKNPPPAQCLAADELGPPPGSGGDGPKAEFDRRKTIAVQMAADPDGKYNMPLKLEPFFSKSGYKVGDQLPAAAQADYIAASLSATHALKANNAAPLDEEKFYSGGFAFEWRDEWWKDNVVTWFHSVSGNVGGCSSACQCTNTGAANPVFPGGWGDEQWFGLTGATISGRTNPAEVANANGLIGNPDILEPRAAIVAMCRAFSADGQCN
jgi:hypothetical protein